MIVLLILGHDHAGVANHEAVVLRAEHHLDALERIVQQSGKLFLVEDELCHLSFVQLVAGEQVLLSGDIQLVLL